MASLYKTNVSGQCLTAFHHLNSPKILAVEVRILACQLESLVPHEAVNAELRSPVELDEMSLALGILKSERVYSKSLHHAV